MKIATAAYPLDPLDSWAQYEDKLDHWVSEAADADLLVFPEYAAMELAALEGPGVAADLERSIRAVSDRMGEAAALHQRLAARYGVHILGASAPVLDPAVAARPVNRAMFYAPDGKTAHQDKQIMTRFERDPWDIAPGGPLKLLDTALGRIGILICYDSEFPLLGRALAEADVILVPSCTETQAGYWRVRIGAMARALEGQCVTAMASIVGDALWCEGVERGVGAGGIFGPPDHGFPPSGVLAEGALNAPGWTYAEADLSAIAAVRANGGVLNRLHWSEQEGRCETATKSPLRGLRP